jgi:signal transduction histidine kinase
VRLRTQLALWYSAILLASLVLISGWAYYEVVVEHPAVSKALAKEGHTPIDEFIEIMLYGGLPALLIALIGGWILMRRALSPVNTLTTTLESIHVDTLGRQLPRSGNGDELDRLAEVFNSMMMRLDQSFTRVREFTINASHELKTPLTIMRGEIETRLRDSPPSAVDREFLASQLDEIARLAKIVDALTLLAKADSGQFAIAREPVRLDELVRDFFEDARILAQPTHVQVEMNTCDEVTVRGDRHRLRQLLLNLTDNAIKYNQPDGRVVMGLTRNNGAVELKIANTGPGISAEKLPRVFDRFYRGDQAHTGEVEGSGLGLSIAQWIVKAHGGAIELASKPEQWTTVTVRFPVPAAGET